MNYMFAMYIEIAIFGFFGFLVSLLLAIRMKGSVMELTLKGLSLAFFLMACLFILQLMNMQNSIYAVLLIGLAMLVACVSMVRLFFVTQDKIRNGNAKES